MMAVALMLSAMGGVRAWAQSSTPRQETWVTDGVVTTIALTADTVYIGGGFSHVGPVSGIGGVARNRLAAIDIATGVATDWNPNPDSLVRALAVNGSTVYVGGSFNSIGGQTRNGIAALNATTGNATSWNPNASSSVHALAADGATVYAGGDFTSTGGPTRNRTPAPDAASSRPATA